MRASDCHARGRAPVLQEDRRALLLWPEARQHHGRSTRAVLHELVSCPCGSNPGGLFTYRSLVALTGRAMSSEIPSCGYRSPGTVDHTEASIEQVFFLARTLSQQFDANVARSIMNTSDF
eukprot:7361990-Pyramimonas_sp.AAC.1